MKKIGYLFSLSAILFGSLSFQAPKANAGVITILKSVHDIGAYGTGISVGGIVIGAASITGGFVLANIRNADPYHIAGIIMIVLDAKQDHQSAIEQHLSNTYSFIDDREVLKDLAALVESKLSTAGAYDSEMTVSIPENEVRAVFAQTSLSTEQIQAVVADLR